MIIALNIQYVLHFKYFEYQNILYHGFGNVQVEIIVDEKQ
jgi:hypothetical protein